MRCANCGAEIGNSKFCTFCGTQISYNMRREQEQINKVGCPRCKSSNIEFQRETQGEISNYNSRYIINKTVGFCKDCGLTWYTDNGNTQLPIWANNNYNPMYPQQIVTSPPPKDNTNWWVLGWIFFFPAPVMVLIWRKKNTWDKKTKWIVTALFWITLVALYAIGTKK